MNIFLRSLAVGLIPLAMLVLAAAAPDSRVLMEEMTTTEGEAAVVVGVSTMKGKWKDADISGTSLFTRVWVRRSNRWQAQTIQQTRAAENWDDNAIKPK